MTVENREACIKKTLGYEGGYTNDPRDPGGPTNYGITIADARKYWKADADASDVKAMPLAVAVQIYRERYWAPAGCDQLPAGLDLAVYDFGVNSGVSRSLKYLATTKGTTTERIEQLCDARLQFLKGLKTWGVFGKGWGRRVADVKATALAMAKAPVVVQPVPPPPDIPRPEPAPAPVNPIAQIIIAIFKAIFRRKS